MNIQTLRQLEEHYRGTRQLFDQKQITPEDYQYRVNQLRYTDPQGITWQISTDGQWLRWDGSQWSEADPYGDAYDNVAAEYQKLQSLRLSSQIDEPTYATNMAGLRVTEPTGEQWSIHPESGKWVTWNGQIWVEGEPPRRAADGSSSSEESEFVEFENEYRRCYVQLQANQNDRAEFDRCVDKLRCMDENGVWWQISKDTGGWITWNGQQWIPGQPPREKVSVDGPARKFAATVKESAKEEFKATVKSIPMMVVRMIITRAIMMVTSYYGAMYLHAYWLGYKNDGFRDDGGPWCPWLQLTQTTQGDSYAYIWGIGGMLLSSVVITLFSRQPLRNLGGAIKAPFAVLASIKDKGIFGMAAMALGAGIALLIASKSGINQQAHLSLGIGLLFMGAGRPGYYIARFFSGIVRRVMAPTLKTARDKIPVDLRVVQLAFLGIAPGFYFASRLIQNTPERAGEKTAMMAGIVLIGIGLFSIFGMKKKKAAPGTICTILLCGIFGTFLAILLDLIFAKKVLADDGGRDEFTGNPADYWKTEGRKLLDASKGAADAAGAGAAAGGGLNPPNDPPEDPYTTSLCLDSYSMTLTQSMNEDVRAWVVVSGKDPVKCANLEATYNAQIQMTVTGNITEWFSPETTADAGGATCRFYVEVPEDPDKRRGPNIAYVVATVQAGPRTLSKKCRINMEVQGDYALSMDDVVNVKANEPGKAYYAFVQCNDPALDGSEQLEKSRELAPKIKFELAGEVANWVGGPGEVAGYTTADGKEIKVEAVVPADDLKKEPPFTVEVEVSCESREFGSLSKGGRIEIEPPDWFVELQPIKDKMMLDFKDAASFRVRLIPLDDSKMQLYGGENNNMLNEYLSIRVEGSNEKYAILEEKETDGTWRFYDVKFSEASSGVQVEPFLDIVAEANLTGRQVNQKFRINLAAKPTFVFKDKSVSICAGGDPVDVLGQVKDGEGFEWSLRLDMYGLDEIEKPEEPEMEEGEKFTITLKAAESENPALQIKTGKFKVVAVAPKPDSDEEIETEPVELEIKLGAIGLIIQPSPVRLPFDPVKEKATEFRVRVVSYDTETKIFKMDVSAMQLLEMDEWEEGDDPKGPNVFNGAGVLVKFERQEGAGLDAVAIWSVKQKIQVPAMQIIDALMPFTAPGDWGEQSDKFEKSHKFIIPADPSAMQAERIRIEQENCRKTLKYLPDGELKTRFSKAVESDAKTLGAEGLFHLRHEIWNAAQDALMKEAQSYLESAEFTDKIITVLEWTSYLGQLIVQGMSSVMVPFPGDMAVSMLYNSVPDLIGSVYAGQSASDWFKNWANGILGGGVGMVADMAIGQLVNLEDDFLRYLAMYKDPRKAGLFASVKYLSARIIRYQAINKPDGEPYSLKETIINSLRDLAEEIVTCGISKHTKTEMKGPGHGYDPKDGRSYHDADGKPDLSGMPAKNVKAAQDIAKKHNVEIYIRPTNPASKKLLEQGAHPKPESIKSKTINEIDVKLGRKPGDVGKVGYFDPGPNPPPKGNMSDADYAKVKERYEQRKQEFVDNQKDMGKLKDKGVTVTEDGVIIAKDGKPYTGDHDIFDIRGPDGKPLTKEQYDKVMADLMKPPFSAQHNGHRQWDYSKADKYTPPPQKDPKTGKWVQPKSKYNKNKGVDEKIKDSHQGWTSKGEKGEGLIKVGTDGGLSNKSFDAHGKTLDKGGRLTQSGTSSIRHTNEDQKKELDGPGGIKPKPTSRPSEGTNKGKDGNP